MTRGIPILSAGLFLLATLLATSCDSCAGPGETDGGTTQDGGPLGGPVESISISPATATLDLPLSGSRSQTYTITAHVKGGGTQDVTAQSWLTVVGSGATVSGTTLTAALPGRITVTGHYSTFTATATLEAKRSGEIVVTGTPANGSAVLAGNVPAGSPKPTIAYPLEGALFPSNMGAFELQVTRTHASQSLVRLSVVGSFVELHVVGPCGSIPGAADGCGLVVPSSVVPSLIAASEAPDMGIVVRLAAPDGSQLVESARREVRWSNVPLSGGLYYWSTSANGGTAIRRLNLDTPEERSVNYFTVNDHAPTIEGTKVCMGCHSLSRDGTRIGMSFGGSDPGHFGLYDVSTRTPVAQKFGPRAWSGPSFFSAMSSIAPDSSSLITVRSGVLTLRQANANLDVIQDALFANQVENGDKLTEPDWAPTGNRLAFVGWNPGMYTCPDSQPNCQKDNGDLTPFAQIYVADINGSTVSNPRLLVPRASNPREYSSHYPAISDDALWLVFNRTPCNGPDNRMGYPVSRIKEDDARACCGYDSPGARLMLVSMNGGVPVDLARMNDTGTWTNTWPRWGPEHGRYQGKNLYFIAFSSKRSYGLRIQGSQLSTNAKPQLWVGAIAVDPAGTITADPSFAPVWVPMQNADDASPTGNHTPQWAAVAVEIPG